ncbi:MAG TPA: RodZ domain-containing protein [Bryobacteraceae bacterium]|nr:RodZ domain-containing protein [Bryobacteraceae bacterium]
MTSPGDAFRSERLRRGLTLEQLAAETRISLHCLEAMETNQFEHLPAGAYRRSFLRLYARALGLNENEIVDWFEHEYEEPELPLPQPPSEPKHRHAATAVWMLMTAGALAGLYSLWQHEDRRFALTASTTVLRPAAKSPVASKPSQAPESPLSTPSGQASTKTPQTPPSPATADIHSVRVAFSATEPVWVSVKCDGLPTYSGTVEGPQQKEFDASDKMTVLVGNAGGLVGSLNGKPFGPLGARGEVQLLEFTSEGARVLMRRAPSEGTRARDEDDPTW